MDSPSDNDSKRRSKLVAWVDWFDEVYPTFSFGVGLADTLDGREYTVRLPDKHILRVEFDEKYVAFSSSRRESR